MEKPLAAIVSAAFKGNKILLIKRKKNPFAGCWSLLGGKIEFGEHVYETAVREMKEETGLDTKFRSFEGVVSEHVLEKGKVLWHFLLFVCRLDLADGAPVSSGEGELKWFTLKEIEKNRDALVPSDYLMLKKMVFGKEGHHFNSVMEKTGNKYRQKVFEKV